jgi:hypothetical protein
MQRDAVDPYARRSKAAGNQSPASVFPKALLTEGRILRMKLGRESGAPPESPSLPGHLVPGHLRRGHDCIADTGDDFRPLLVGRFCAHFGTSR